MAKMNYISKEEFLAYDPLKLEAQINNGEVLIVKQYLDKSEVDHIKQRCNDFNAGEEPSWHPLLDDCPDYHRINDEYEKSYVKAKMHLFLFHLWYEKNKDLFGIFESTFDLKRKILNKDSLDYVTQNIPSSGYVSRVVVQHYPRGGGYLSKHTDPVNHLNPVQTLIQLSTKGKDYTEGGLFIEENGVKTNLDDHWEEGDLLMFTQAIPHGVDSIDPSAPLDWTLGRGRLMAIPLSLRSDYLRETEESPKQL
jgi:hypothetical protein